MPGGKLDAQRIREVVAIARAERDIVIELGCLARDGAIGHVIAEQRARVYVHFLFAGLLRERRQRLQRKCSHRSHSSKPLRHLHLRLLYLRSAIDWQVQR